MSSQPSVAVELVPRNSHKDVLFFVSTIRLFLASLQTLRALLPLACYCAACFVIFLNETENNPVRKLIYENVD